MEKCILEFFWGVGHSVCNLLPKTQKKNEVGVGRCANVIERIKKKKGTNVVKCRKLQILEKGIWSSLF